MLIVLLLLFKTLFSILLLTLAGALFAIYFHGCASFFKRHLHVSSGWSLALSIVINLILFVVFIWFVGARLQQQVTQLTDTLPQTIDNGKAYLQKQLLEVRSCITSILQAILKKPCLWSKVFFPPVLEF